MNPGEVEEWLRSACDTIEDGDVRGSQPFTPIGILLLPLPRGLVQVSRGVATLTDSDQRWYVQRGETRSIVLAAQDLDPEDALTVGDNTEGWKWWVTVGRDDEEESKERTEKVCRDLCVSRGWTDSRVVSEHEWTRDGSRVVVRGFDTRDSTGESMRCAQRACGVRISGEWDEPTREAVRLRRRQYGMSDEAVIDKNFLLAIGMNPWPSDAATV